MIFIFIIQNVYGNDGIAHASFNFDKDFVNDEDCFYNITYHEKIFSNSVVCIFQCKFDSIKSYSYNAAATIVLRNTLGFKNYIYNCSFTDCSSYLCGAIYLDLQNKCLTEIINSSFTKNSAIQDEHFNNGKAGAIYSSSMNNGDIQIKNCLFKFNDSQDIGGAIHILKMKYLIKECSFFDNFLNRNYGNIYGGAIYLAESNGKIKKSYFKNNYITGEKFLFGKFIYGGAIYMRNSYALLKKCNFTKNSVLKYGDTLFGGAISFVSSEGSFCECIFINNKLFSEDARCFGGAITFSNSKGLFNNCSFINNSAYSKSSNSNGGAVSFSESFGEFNNCSFTNNIAEVFLGNFLVFGDYPRIFGGAIVLFKSTFVLTNCSLQNNTGFGNSPEYITTGNGGAIYSLFSNVNLKNCSFKNNSLLIYGYKFDIDCNIEGGACNFLSSEVQLEFCSFINNTAKLQICENSKYFSAKIYGGAIYSDNFNIPINCICCVFINNSAFIPNKHQNEFAGAIYLTYGKLINCTFIDNTAFNACDIKFDQKNKSSLIINNIIFYNSNISSMLCIKKNDLDTFLVNISTNFINQSYIDNNNATLDFNSQLSKDEKMVIFRENKINSIEFQLYFESKCYIIENKVKQVVETPKFHYDIQISIISYIRIILISAFLVLLILIAYGILSKSLIKSTKTLNLQ